MILLLCAALARAQDPAVLVGKLPSESVQERDEATEKLRAIGAPALPALRRDAEGTDAEEGRR
jgi:hypothetical protein